MKSPMFLLVCVMFLVGSWVVAQEKGGSDIFDKTAAPVDDVGERLLYRDPFWPVGYIPRSERVSEEEKAVSVKTSKETEQPRISLRERSRVLEKRLQAELNIDGFVQGTEGLLVFIGGKVVGLGDQLTVKIKNTVYRLEICFLSKGSIKFKLLNNTDNPQNPKERK